MHMCIGTAATIGIITAGVSAGTSIAGAKMASNASKNAAKTQSSAADKALAAQQQGYAQQRSDFSPYQQAGAAAVGRLGQTAGTYTGGPPQPQGPQMGGQLGQMPQNWHPPQSPPLGPPQQGQPQPGMGPGPQGHNVGVNLGQQGAVPQAPGGGPMPGSLVRVQAPSGEVAMLPREAADRAVQKGARVLQ